MVFIASSYANALAAAAVAVGAGMVAGSGGKAGSGMVAGAGAVAGAAGVIGGGESGRRVFTASLYADASAVGAAPDVEDSSAELGCAEGSAVLAALSSTL